MRSPGACRAAVLIGETADELEELIGRPGAGRSAAASMDEAVARPPLPRDAGRRGPARAGGRQLRHVRRLRRARRRVPGRSRASASAEADGGRHDRGLAVTGARRAARRAACSASATSRRCPLLVAVLALVAIGVVMVYSASSVAPYWQRRPGAQGIAAGHLGRLGLAPWSLVSRIDFRLSLLRHPGLLSRRWSLLVIVLIPSIGFGPLDRAAGSTSRASAVPAGRGRQAGDLPVPRPLARSPGTEARGLLEWPVPVRHPRRARLPAHRRSSRTSARPASTRSPPCRIFFMAGANLLDLGAVGGGGASAAA